MLSQKQMAANDLTRRFLARQDENGGLGLSRAKTTTMRLEDKKQVGDKVARVTMQFNQLPTKEEIKEHLASAFKNAVEPVEHSFRLHPSAGLRQVVTGFVRKGKATLPKGSEKSMEQIAKNVWMDKVDQSIWQVGDDGELVKTATGADDLSAVLDIPNLSPVNPRAPVVAGMHVASMAPDPTADTRYICFVDAEYATVSFGAQISDERVFDRNDLQSIEIAEDLVVDIEHLRGMDRIVSSSEDDDNEPDDFTEEALAKYYKHVFRFNPDYFDKVEKVVTKRSLL